MGCIRPPQPVHLTPPRVALTTMILNNRIVICGLPLGLGMSIRVDNTASLHCLRSMALVHTISIQNPALINTVKLTSTRLIYPGLDPPGDQADFSHLADAVSPSMDCIRRRWSCSRFSSRWLASIEARRQQVGRKLHGRSLPSGTQICDEFHLHNLMQFQSYHLVFIDESGCDKRIGFRLAASRRGPSAGGSISPRPASSDLVGFHPGPFQ
jgi:hypothetical protein